MTGECDAASGVVKRVTRLESLRRAPEQPQILGPADMYKFCVEKFKDSKWKFLFISKEEVERVKVFLAARFATGKTIKGTQQFHSIRVHSKTEVVTRYYSLEKNGKVIKLVTDNQMNFQINQFVALRFQLDFNIGIIRDIDEEGLHLSLMKKKSQKNKLIFYWPVEPTEYYASTVEVLCTVAEPSPSKKSTNAYTVSQEDIENVKKLVLEVVKN